MLTEYCLGFMFDDEGTQVALIKKNRPARHRGQWNGIGGHVEKGESSIEAMVREFKEEAGCKTLAEWWKHVATADGRGEEGDFTLYIFAAFNSGAGIMVGENSATDEKVSIFRVDNLPEKVVPNLRWIVPLCLDGSTPPLTIENIHNEG